MPRKPKAPTETPSAAVAESATPAPKKRASPKKATAATSAAKPTAARAKKSATPARSSDAAPKRAAKPKTLSTKSRAPRMNATSAAASVPGTPAFEANSYHDDIARLAYRFWEQRGRVEGSPEEDWLRAEQELRRTVLVESA